jgi:hypothetical protein
MGVHELIDLCAIRLHVKLCLVVCVHGTNKQAAAQSMFDSVSAKSILLFLLKITIRIPWRMCLYVIIELFAGELALPHFVLVLVCCDAVFSDSIAMAVFNGFRGVGGGLGGFVAVHWSCGGWRGRRGVRRGRGVVDSCGANSGGCGKPRKSVWFAFFYRYVYSPRQSR